MLYKNKEILLFIQKYYTKLVDFMYLFMYVCVCLYMYTFIDYLDHFPRVYSKAVYEEGASCLALKIAAGNITTLPIYT